MVPSDSTRRESRSSTRRISSPYRRPCHRLARTAISRQPLRICASHLSVVSISGALKLCCAMSNTLQCYVYCQTTVLLSRRNHHRPSLQNILVPWYIDNIMEDQDTRVEVERVQTGVRMEKRLLKVLKGLAELKDLTLGDL